MINNLILAIIIVIYIINIFIILYLKETLKEYKGNFKIIEESLFDSWKEIARIRSNQDKMLKYTIEVLDSVNKELKDIKSDKKCEKTNYKEANMRQKNNINKITFKNKEKSYYRNSMVDLFYI